MKKTTKKQQNRSEQQQQIGDQIAIIAGLASSSSSLSSSSAASTTTTTTSAEARAAAGKQRNREQNEWNNIYTTWPGAWFSSSLPLNLWMFCAALIPPASENRSWVSVAELLSVNLLNCRFLWNSIHFEREHSSIGYVPWASVKVVKISWRIWVTYGDTITNK